MDDLVRRIAAERENVERTLVYLDEALAREPLGRIELAAIAAFLQNVYNELRTSSSRWSGTREGKFHRGQPGIGICWNWRFHWM